MVDVNSYHEHFLYLDSTAIYLAQEIISAVDVKNLMFT